MCPVKQTNKGRGLFPSMQPLFGQLSCLRQLLLCGSHACRQTICSPQPPPTPRTLSLYILHHLTSSLTPIIISIARRQNVTTGLEEHLAQMNYGFVYHIGTVFLGGFLELKGFEVSAKKKTTTTTCHVKIKVYVPLGNSQNTRFSRRVFLSKESSFKWSTPLVWRQKSQT